MGTIDIDLITSSNIVAFANLESFTIGFKISNRSSEKQNIKLSDIKLFMNGKPSIAWSLTLQNGTSSQIVLQPDQEKIFQWNLGNALFQSIGSYELQLVFQKITQIKQIIVTD